MANMKYVSDNKLTVQADAQKLLNKKIVVIVGSVATVGLFFVHIYASLFALVASLMLWVVQNGNEILRAGAVGEDYSLDLLAQLPDEFIIYNQVDIPNKKSKTGFNEADIIVVGPNTIFIIEVKHNNGAIIGSEENKEFRVDKIGRGGTPYSKTMRNPISQVKKLVWLLSEEMKRKQLRAWIQGIVLFSNDDAEVSICSTSIPVLRSDEITHFIQSYNAKSRISDKNKVIENIAKLKRL